MRIQGLASLSLAGGVPGWLFNSGEFTNTFIDNGVGDVSINMVADRGLAITESLWLLQQHGGQAASQLTSYGLVHVSATQKRITILREAGGGGASTLADIPVDIACLKLNGTDKQQIFGAGSVQFTAGVPSWIWHSGSFSDTIIDNAPGVIRLTHALGHFLNSNFSGLYMLTARGVLAASELTSYGLTSITTQEKEVTILREGAAGAASTLSDIPFDILALQFGPPGPSDDANQQDTTAGLKLVAEGLVQFNAGVPSFTWQNGAFSNTIVDTGVGDITLNLMPGKGILAAECCGVASPLGAQAASGLRAVAINHVSATAKQITMLQEQGAGAASARADIDTYVALYQRIGFR